MISPEVLSDSSRPRSLSVSPAYAACVAFVAGFNVMLLEMCAFRVLQTTFGSSIYVTGVLLALVMIALSLGYFLGGRFSRRFSRIEVLLGVLVLAALYVTVTGLWIPESILDFCYERRTAFDGRVQGRVFASSLATLLLYAPPMAAMSQASPYLIKLLCARHEGGGDVGATAGTLMSVSTFGSIAGTLLPSLFLIPTFGVPATLWLLVGSIVAVSCVGLVLVGSRRLALASVLVLATVGAGEVARARLAQAAPQVTADGTLVASAESLYGNVKIYRAVEADGAVRFVYKPSRNYSHSTVYPDHPFRDQFTLSYVNLGLARGAKRYLVLGVALGAVITTVLAQNPDAEITAVEIDPFIIDLARRFVPSLNNPRVHYVVQDARQFLKEDRGSYDYIIVDIFSGESLPTHCMTQEFFALTRERLSDDGALMVNTNLWDFSVQSGLERPAPFVSVRHIQSALLRDGFASVFIEDYFEYGFLYAFKRPTPLEALRERLAGLALSPEVDPDLRAAMALAYLTLVPVPSERRELRPFTDTWVPEGELSLKENLPLFLDALAHASAQPEWSSQVASKGNTDLRFIMARHYAALAIREGTSTGAFLRYMRGPSGDHLCADVADWASRTQGDLFPALSLYLHNRVAVECAGRLPATPALSAGRGLEQLRAFVLAAPLLNDNLGRQALPLLAQAVESTL